MPHTITVDVEDWYQSTFDSSAGLSARFESSTMKVLESFAAHQVRATFYVLGLAAAQAPSVVKAIARAGHEVQSHGYGHVEIFKLTEEEFRQDLVRAKGMLEDLIAREIYGYRAPSFSIDGRTPWALDALAATGHRYDSSIFPMRMNRYGVANYPTEPRVVLTPAGRRIVEAPVAVATWFGRRVPIGGGGYFRLWPYYLIRAAWRQRERAGVPGIMYMHPYEYDPAEIEAYKGRVSRRMRLHQGLGRKGFRKKLERLMREFQFLPLGELLSPWLKDLS